MVVVEKGTQFTKVVYRENYYNFKYEMMRRNYKVTSVSHFKGRNGEELIRVYLMKV